MYIRVIASQGEEETQWDENTGFRAALIPLIWDDGNTFLKYIKKTSILYLLTSNMIKMTTGLEEYLADNFVTTEDEISEVIKHFKYIKAGKNEVLIKSGDVCRYFYFVLKGCVRTYFNDAEGTEATRYVAFENQFITTMHSFIEQSPSNEYICTVEPSELLAISYKDFELAMSNIPLFKDLYIKQLERTYMTNHGRIEIFLRLNAKQRYEYILQNNKQIIQRLSNKLVAGFLGITQESLSRLKAKK